MPELTRSQMLDFIMDTNDEMNNLKMQRDGYESIRFAVNRAFLTDHFRSFTDGQIANAYEEWLSFYDQFMLGMI